MSDRRGSTLYAGFVASVFIVTAAVAAWLVIGSGLLTAGSSALGRPVKDPVTVVGAPVETEESVQVTDALQLSQPRDPFRPLITPDSPVVLIPGVGGIPGTGGEDGSFVPGSTSVTLVEIREVDGELRATIVVNGVTYDVAEGDTFAGSYKVIELTEDSAIIMFGDTAFELKVGQQILK